MSREDESQNAKHASTKEEEGLEACAGEEQAATATEDLEEAGKTTLQETISEMHKDPLAIGVPLPVLRTVKRPPKKEQQLAGGGGEGRSKAEEAGPMHLARVNRSSLRRVHSKNGEEEEEDLPDIAPAVASLPEAAGGGGGGGGIIMDESDRMEKYMAIHTALHDNEVNQDLNEAGAEDPDKSRARREMDLTHEQLEGTAAGRMRSLRAAQQLSTSTSSLPRFRGDSELLRQLNTSLRSLPGAFSVDGIGPTDTDSNDGDDSSVGANSLPLQLDFQIEFLAEATLVEESRRDNHGEGSRDEINEDNTIPENSLSRSEDCITCPRCDLSRTATEGSHQGTEFLHGSAEFSPPSDQERAASVVSSNPIVEATPVQDKSRRTLILSIVILGVLILLALIIPLTIMSNKDPSSPPNDSPKFNDDTILTEAPEPICFSLLPLMTNESQACPDPTTLPHGGPLCQLVADGLLEASDPDAQIDIALINGGAMRGDILPGPLTADTVRSWVLPFVEDWVVYLSVTPAQLKASLESSLFDTGYVITEEQQKQFFPESPSVNLTWSFESHYPYTAGLRYNVNLTAPEGERFTDFEFQPRQSSGAKGWYSLDVTNNRTLLRVLTTNYLADGGDGYFPDGIPEERKAVQEDLGVTALFILYCSEQSEIIGPDVPDGMSTQNFVPLEGF